MTEPDLEALRNLLRQMLKDEDCQTSWEGQNLMKPPNAEEWATYYRRNPE